MSCQVNVPVVKGLLEGANTDPEHCVFCHRNTSPILCRACGHIFQGRVRAECVYHPAVIHLMDYDCCPQCKAHQIKELAIK